MDEKNRQALADRKWPDLRGRAAEERGAAGRERLPVLCLQHLSLLHHVNAGLRAHTLFERNVDYIVQKDETRHRRRAHRSYDAGSSLVRWSASGR
ncbi:hypothetical protein ACLK2C_00540 [Escherichia coli]